MKKHWLTIPEFYPQAKKLRQIFDQRFQNPKEAGSERFVWDYWHLPDQYTHLRTPAYHYFSKSDYEALHRHIVDWGRRTLGCWDISPPWLSCYVEGCEQRLHADVPHGPLAWVFSLTNWKARTFTGGETVIFRPETLSYWSNFQGAQDREYESFVERIAPKFNQLTVFDPRLPHGVEQVRGTQDPRDGRLVIHGWFTRPRPFIEGRLSEKATEKTLNQMLSGLGERIQDFGQYHGLLSLRASLTSSGAVSAVDILFNSLVPLDGDPAEGIVKLAKNALRSTKFPRPKGKARVTLPLIFE